MAIAAPTRSEPKKEQRLWRVDADGTLQVGPHWGQSRVLLSQKRFIMMIAGSQSGKTSLGPYWLWTELQAKGPGDYLVVTPTYPMLRLKVWPEFMNLWHRTLHLGVWRAGDKVYAIPPAADSDDDTETRIIFGSASHPESLESATAKGAWLDECGQAQFRLASWEAVVRRLSLHEGRALGTTTPYNLGWLKMQVYDRWAAGDPDYDVIQFSSIMNPAFPKSEYRRAKRTLPKWKFDMFHRGILARPAGMIYSDFVNAYREAGGHKVHPFPLPSRWPRYGGLDFGAVHTAKLACAYDPDADVYYLYDEMLDGGKSTNDHVADASVWMESVNWQTWSGGSKSEDQQRMDWGAAGIYVQEPLVADVEAGIDRVIALWKTRRLFVFDTCTKLIDEIEQYARKLNDRDEPTNEIADKATFHLLDALRYLVQQLGGGVGVEFY